MAAGKYNFTIEQGATVDFEIAYTDSNGDPIDLTGYDARMQLAPYCRIRNSIFNPL